MIPSGLAPRLRRLAASAAVIGLCAASAPVSAGPLPSSSLASSSLAGGAFEAGLPGYRPGDTFIFDNRRVERVGRIDGEHVVWRTRSGREYVRHRNFIVPILEWQVRDRIGKRKVFGKPNKLWPLKEGRRVRFRVVTETEDLDGSGRRRTVNLWACKVGDKQLTDTDAGPFETFPIQCERFSHNSMRLIQRHTWHYAPTVGHYVRRETVSFFTGERKEFELAVMLPAHLANDRRIRMTVRDLAVAAK